MPWRGGGAHVMRVTYRDDSPEGRRVRVQITSLLL
jgi:hypothetical protein